MVDVDNVASSPSAKHGKSRKARESLDGSEISFRDLSDYDDVCCELFLDKALLGFRTYKMNPISNHQAWLLPDIDHLGHFRSLILPIVRMGMLGKRDLSWTTEHVIRALVDESWERNEQESEFISERVYGSFRKFMSIKSSKQMAQFREHVNRYLLMYHPQAGYEISRTYRYSRVSQKAEGEQINLCTGYIAILTEEDEDWLSDRDFSVITLSSKKASSLFLGPARFVNHDCEPNCVFTPQKRTNIIWFTVVRPIGRGEEITASYGDNYFGNENAECLCATCERLQRGGYRSREWSDDLMSQDQSRQSRGARLARASRPRQGVFSVKETFDRIMGTANMAKLSLGGELCITCGQVIDAREERDLGEEEGERTCVRCRRHRALFDQAWPERKSPGMQMAVELVEELAREYRMKRESPQATTEGEESSDMDEDVSFKPRSMLIPPTLATHDSLTGYCSGVFVVSTPVWGAITTKAVAGVGDAPVTMDYVKDKGFAPVLVEKTDEDEVDEDGELEVEIDAGVVEQVLRDVPGGIQVWGDSRAVVFVRGHTENSWKPAIVVPFRERDKEMPDGPVVVRHLALTDGQYAFQSLHPPDDTLLRFELTSEPFLTWSRDPEFFKLPGTQEALSYLQNGKAPLGFRWRLWKEKPEKMCRRVLGLNDDRLHIMRLAAEKVMPVESPLYTMVHGQSSDNWSEPIETVTLDVGLARLAQQECGLNKSLFENARVSPQLPLRRNQPVFALYGGRWKRCVVEDAFLVSSNRFEPGSTGIELAVRVLAVGDVGQKLSSGRGLYREVVRGKDLKLDVPL